MSTPRNVHLRQQYSLDDTQGSTTTIHNKQKIKVGINGFGRIGRLLARFCLEPESPLQLVHVNDIHGDASTAAYLLQFDSVHGRFVGKSARLLIASINFNV